MIISCSATFDTGKEVTPMGAQQIDRVSGLIIVVLSLTALIAVLSGYAQPPQPDEGAAAHIFQLSIVALVPMILLFLVTADWKRPLRSARALIFSTASLVLAFGALYYLEHYR
jgi:hypothetical protein